MLSGTISSLYMQQGITDCLRSCLPLLREHSKRDELLELSINAGDSARARGAHEVYINIGMNIV